MRAEKNTYRKRIQDALKEMPHKNGEIRRDLTLKTDNVGGQKAESYLPQICLR